MALIPDVLGSEKTFSNTLNFRGSNLQILVDLKFVLIAAVLVAETE